MEKLRLLEKARNSVAAKVGRTRTKNGETVLPSGLRIPAVIKTLLDTLGEEDLANVARVYRDAMTATRRFWKNEGTDAKGKAKGRWVVEPDHRTRISAANMVAAYMEGLPVQRQIALRGEFSELGDMIREMNESGEARRLLPALVGRSESQP
jgi:hypothetical protein